MNARLLCLPVILFLICSTARGHQAPVSPPIEAQVAEQIQRLDTKNEKADRLNALRWLDQQNDSGLLDRAIPALERCVRDDPEPEVRSAGIQTLARLQLRWRKPCPASLAEALLDRTDEVRWQAGIWAAMFQEFTPAAVAVLRRGAKSDRPGVRSNILLLLGKAARKDEQLLPAIRDGIQDPDWEVRDCAHLALYHATDQLDDFLPYVARERAAAHRAGPVRAEETPEEKQLRENRNLRMIGVAGEVCRWLESRPKDVGRILGEMLQDRDASERYAAAVFLTDFAAMYKVMKSSPEGKNNEDGPGRVEEYLRQNTPQEQAERTAQLARQLKDLGLLERLEKVAARDPAKEPREAAAETLRTLSRPPAQP